MLADLALRWWGPSPTTGCGPIGARVGGPDSPWLSLLAYAAQTAAVAPDEVATGPLARNLQEMIAAHLLDDWRAAPAST